MPQCELLVHGSRPQSTFKKQGENDQINRKKGDISLKKDRNTNIEKNKTNAKINQI